ncbi:hypothetical protein [Traorella massiliensis]|uniref:hypothetical protein n=1 Tax=Traorella massiliensis TaxID=1903263 RepID=UPI002356673E|nr:hypothetical protein [Traorella massiliensis]
MKKIAVSLLALFTLVGCQKERTIEVNMLDTGYTIEPVSTIENIPVNTGIWQCTIDEKVSACTAKYDQDYVIQGYGIYDFETNQYRESDTDPIPEDETYGYLSISTSEYNVYYKVISDYESQMNTTSYFVEKDGQYTFLRENTQSMDLSSDYQHLSVYEENDKAYLVYDEDNELIINEITSDGYKEIERKPLQIDDYTLSNYYYDDTLVLEYSSDEDDLLIINDEEYHLELYSHYIIFDDILLVSNYTEPDGGNMQDLLNTYVIDRQTKEVIELDTNIDTNRYRARYDDYYYSYNEAGELVILRYNDSIDIITTSINYNSVDNLNTLAMNNGIYIFEQDYISETMTISLLSLTKEEKTE